MATFKSNNPPDTFDPLQYGAVPITGTSNSPSDTFDPLQYGAVPITDVPSPRFASNQPDWTNVGGGSVLDALGPHLSQWQVPHKDVEQTSLTPRFLAKSAVRPIVNAGLSLATGLENLMKIPANVVGLLQESGGLTPQGIVQTGRNFLSGLSDTLIGQPLNFLKDTVQNIKDGYKSNGITGAALETSGNIVQGFYKAYEENPVPFVMALQGASDTVSKWTGTPKIDVVSKVGSPVTKTASKVFSRVSEPIIESLAPKFSAKRTQFWSDTLRPSKSSIQSEARWHKDTPQHLTNMEREGVNLPLSKNRSGKLDTTRAYNSLKEVYKAEAPIQKTLLQASGEWIPLDEAEAKMMSDVTKNFDGTERTRAQQYLQGELDAYKTTHAADIVHVEDGKSLIRIRAFDDIKDDFWSKGKFKPLQSAADTANSKTSKIAGHAAEEIIQDKVGQDNIVGRFNQRLGNHQAAMDMLEKANNNAVGPGLLGRISARALGGIIGSVFGPVGEIAGAITVDKLMSFLSDPGRSLSATSYVLSRAAKEAPQVLNEVLGKIEQYVSEQASRGKLPSPSYIPLPEQFPNETGGFLNESQQEAMNIKSAQITEQRQFEEAWRRANLNRPKKRSRTL